MAAASLDDCNRAARRCFAALKAPREAAEHDLLVEHVVDLPTEILDVDDVIRNFPRVPDLLVLLGGESCVVGGQVFRGLPRVLGPASTRAPVPGGGGVAGDGVE